MIWSKHVTSPSRDKYMIYRPAKKLDYWNSCSLLSNSTRKYLLIDTQRIVQFLSILFRCQQSTKMRLSRCNTLLRTPFHRFVHWVHSKHKYAPVASFISKSHIWNMKYQKIITKNVPFWLKILGSSFLKYLYIEKPTLYF